MKTFRLYILTLLGVALSVGACTNDPATLEGFEADTSTIEASAAGGEYNIAIRSAAEWTAVASSPWIMISPANGRGEVKCKVRIDSTLVNDTRSSMIRFSSAGEILREVAVTQQGFAKHITPEEAEQHIAASASRDDRWFESEIETNIEFKVEAEYDGEDRWLSVDNFELNLDRGARPRTTQLRVNWKINPEPRERVAHLHLVALNSGDELESPSIITIRQAAAPLIEDNRTGDSLAILTIFERLECWSDNGISTTEPMQNWSCVRLWEAGDSSLPTAEAVGRVRDLELSYFNTEEGIPQEIKYLKYLETLSLYGNVNTMLKSIDMGEEVCTLDYLKSLRVAAFGLSSLPASFTLLGDTLEVLDLNSNNLSEVPEALTPENFPHLVSLNLASNRRTMVSNLSNISTMERSPGLHIDTRKTEDLKRLLLWESLEELSLTYNYIEGPLPDFRVGEDGVRAYTAADFSERGDTLQWAVESKLPRVLPNMKRLAINLNFMTGELPEWLLYHPRFLEWTPTTFIYVQQETCYDTEGNVPSFSNVPTSQEYYFEKYPLMRGRFEFNDEIEEE
ncbi:MAG: hypothetical protein IKW52_00290 [Alistipes sp.]|nr:hypothetical protein [Alistipes sp.]